MAAYFNLFAVAVALYKPRLIFPCHYQSGERTANKGGKTFLLALDLLWGAALPALWRDRHNRGRDNGVLASDLFALWEGRVLLILSEDDTTFTPVCWEDLIALIKNPSKLSKRSPRVIRA